MQATFVRNVVHVGKVSLRRARRYTVCPKSAVAKHGPQLTALARVPWRNHEECALNNERHGHTVLFFGD